jgi:arsenical pump membrane protein
LFSFPVAIVVLTLILMLTRPRGLTEAWAAAIGAIALVLTTAVPFARVPRAIGETADVLLFLLGMMVITGIAERARVFDVLAESVVRLARGNGRLLFVLVYLLGAIITATLSLDVTVIVLTPIVFALVARRRIPALPFMFACAFAANIASLILPVSNLTNLLVFDRLELDFPEFVATMWLPNLVATVTNVAIFLWLFRKEIPRHFVREVTFPIVIDRWLVAAGSILAVSLAGILGLGLASEPIWWASVGGGAILLLLAAGTGRTTFRQAVHDVSPSIFVFVVSMTIVVDGFQRAWLRDQAIDFPASLPMALLGSIGLTAVGSNVVNNIPMAVLALGVIERAPEASRLALAYGSLIGANIGPALTTYGSLATMLWLTQLRRRGLEVSTGAYLRVSAITVPPVLLAAGFTLWLVLR